METKTTFDIIPKRIKLASYLVYFTIVIAILKFILDDSMSKKQILETSLALSLGIIIIASIIFLGFKIGQGKNWARTLLLVFFALEILGYTISLSEINWYETAEILSLFQMLVQLYAIILLYFGESKEWFKNK